jgi:hypothetical protein
MLFGFCIFCLYWMCCEKLTMYQISMTDRVVPNPPRKLHSTLGAGMSTAHRASNLVICLCCISSADFEVEFTMVRRQCLGKASRTEQNGACLLRMSMARIIYRRGTLRQRTWRLFLLFWSGDIRFTRLGRTSPGVAEDAWKKSLLGSPSKPACPEIYF